MATTMIDLALDSDEDINIAGGDFSPVESTAQHQRQLILNNKGDFKQNATSCVGAFEYFDDENLQDMVRAISIEFAKDGMNVVQVNIMPDGIIKSDAYYR